MALEKSGAAYMLTGSFASAFYGAPRSTQDIDLVIAATPAQLHAFLGSFTGGDYYVDVDADRRSRNTARDAWTQDTVRDARNKKLCRLTLTSPPLQRT